MPRKSSEKNKTRARKAKQKASAPKRKVVGNFAHYPPSGARLALLAASVLKADRRKKDS